MRLKRDRPASMKRRLRKQQRTTRALRARVTYGERYVTAILCIEN
jgi:hypothetical protein